MDLSCTFECCHWAFVKRGGNVVAHIISRYALVDIVTFVVNGLVHHKSSICALVDAS